MSEETLDEIFQHGRLLLVRPDESLIFKFEAQLTKEDAARIHSQIVDRLPPKIKFLVIGPGIEVNVVRQESQ